ncbi:hypothetical protein [Mesobacillus selenatarsenatis]|uniref:hypothetical protein n=1 Tax=Mesobacillus selenatarsenatis TaxID=388741 RepID=UPI0012EB8FA5|nr:hypothetical protein [Mesobacillus selenatarsenatis]
MKRMQSLSISEIIRILQKNPVNGAINIPCGYLKRYIKEIPNRHIVIIASNELEKNFGARLLKKYGYNVKGYTITGPSQ